MCSIVPALLRDCFGSLMGSSSYERHAEVAISRELSLNCLDYAQQSREIRSAFTDMELSDLPPVAGHTHGKSAAARSSASAFIDVLGPSVGKRSVFLQGSSADQKKGRVTTRHFRWGKDLVTKPTQVEKEDDDLTAMVDVDYYVDMPGHLSRHFRPLVLYTFQPGSAGKDQGEYKFCFEADGKVRYTVSGGGEYCHEVWNWKGDSVAAERTIFGCIPLTYSVFSLERRNVDEDHQLVLLTPLKKFSGFYAWLAKLRAGAGRVERFNPVDGDFVRVKVNGPEGLILSTARVGGYLTADVSVGVDEAIASAARSVQKITHGTVKAKMGMGPGKDTDKKFRGSEILLEYHLRGNPRSDRVDTTSYVRSFQWVKNYQDYEPEKPAMVAFMKPLYDGAFVPDNCKNNDERMVEERVRKLRKPSTTPSPFVTQVMHEFIDLFAQHVGERLIPVEEEEVYRRQDKPSQRRILDEAQHGERVRDTKVFKKNEAYGNVTDPRAISQINGVDKLEYSQFMYALSDKLKEFDWYAFGKKPREVALRVAEICSAAESHADSTDYSRFDGRVNALVRTFERWLMLRLFEPRYHPAMLVLMRSQTGLKAKTSFGVKYDTEFARASGSPETSSFNTILNCFISFLAFRMMRVGGKYLSAREAWERLGVYGGDDGLVADQDRQAAEKAATVMGQVLTLERVKRGEPGVTFLARHYGPDVWFDGETPAVSCADIRRQIAKFHVTVRLSSKITPLVKLREKAFAFYLSDRNTPVLGDFVSKVLQLYPMKRSEYQNHLGIWNSNVSLEDHYPNVQEDWMVDLLLKQLPEFDLVGFYSWLDSATVDTISSPPSFCPPAPADPKPGLVVVEGDFVGEVTKEDTQTESSDKGGSKKEPKKPRKHRPRTKNAYRNAQPPAKASGNKQQGTKKK